MVQWIIFYHASWPWIHRQVTSIESCSATCMAYVLQIRDCFGWQWMVVSDVSAHTYAHTGTHMYTHTHTNIIFDIWAILQQIVPLHITACIGYNVHSLEYTRLTFNVCIAHNRVYSRLLPKIQWQLQANIVLQCQALQLEGLCEVPHKPSRCLLVVVKLPFIVYAKWILNSTDLWLLCSMVVGAHIV